MNVFVDANVIIAVLNKEYPAYECASRFLSLAQDRRFTLFTSSLSLAICWFFVAKKHGKSVAKTKIALLLKHVCITECGEAEALQAIADKKAPDFEDAMQVYSALRADCSHVVTHNLSDFHFSTLNVLDPRDFLVQHAM